MAGSGNIKRSSSSSSSRRRISSNAATSRNSNNAAAAVAHKTWINFNFENCVSVAHEGLPGSPNRYRIRVRMDSGYKLADLKCAWAEPGSGGGGQGKRRHLRLSATAKEAGGAVKANKSFEVLVEPLCQLAADAKPVVTIRKDKEECWIEFPVDQLPASLPVAQD